MLVECSTCESKVDGKERGSVEIDPQHTGNPMKWVLLECPICENPLFGLTELIQVGHDEYVWDSVERKWPAPDSDIDWDIPEIARISLIEAKLCFKARAFSACAVMCGRAIEGVCKHHDPKTRTLANGLKKLKDDGHIDSRLFEWGEALRKHRNLGAHASTVKVVKEDAEDLLDFSIAICEYVFVLNAKFERFQQRQSESS